MKQLTCIIAEDNPSEKFLYAKMLTDGGYHVSGLAENGNELIEQARILCPDFILCDLEMPLRSGIDACRYIRKELMPEVKIICISGFDMVPNTFEIACSHINGYLLKGFNFCNLSCAIQTVFRGGFFIDHLLHKKIAQLPEFESLMRIPELSTAYNDPLRYVLIEHNGEKVKVTDRHVLMVSALYYSKRKEEIAAKLFIEPESVEQSLKRLKSKLHAKDKMELIRIFMQYGLIDSHLAKQMNSGL